MAAAARAFVVVGAALAASASCVGHPFGRPCDAIEQCLDGQHCAVVAGTTREFQMCIECTKGGVDEVPDLTPPGDSPDDPGGPGDEDEVTVNLQCDGTGGDLFLDTTTKMPDFILTETSLEHADVPTTEEITGDLVVVGNELLTTLTLPDLHTVGGKIVIARNGRLETLLMPNLRDALDIKIEDNASGVTCQALMVQAICAGEGSLCECADAPAVDGGVVDGG